MQIFGVGVTRHSRGRPPNFPHFSLRNGVAA